MLNHHTEEDWWNVFFGVLLIAIVWYFWHGNEEWRGFFYPDKHNLTNHVELGIYDSMEECRSAVIDYGKRLRIPPNVYDYECGLNCKLEEGLGGLYVCDETFH